VPSASLLATEGTTLDGEAAAPGLVRLAAQLADVGVGQVEREHGMYLTFMVVWHVRLGY
jgi:hypothetical protein